MVFVVEQAEAHLVPREGPGAELHDAGLLVKWEIGHVDCAGGLKVWKYLFSSSNFEPILKNADGWGEMGPECWVEMRSINTKYSMVDNTIWCIKTRQAKIPI